MADVEQAVIVHANISGIQSEALFDQLAPLEDALSSAIESAKVGEFDGNEIGQGELTLYMYGPDADKLFAVISPILCSSSLVRGGSAELRRGPPGSPSRRVAISAC